VERESAAREASESAEDSADLLSVVGREIRLQIRRHPYAALAAAAGLGFVLGGRGWTRWIGAGAALALRESARWAAREGLRHLVGAPTPAAVFRRETGASSRRYPHH
jgi:hypothetical protein